MRLVGYICESCEHKAEEYFNDSEEKPDKLDRPCPKCGGVLVKNDRKDNCHRYYFADRNGGM